MSDPTNSGQICNTVALADVQWPPPSRRSRHVGSSKIRLVGCWGFTTVPVTKTIRLSEWVTPGDTAIPGMTSLKDGDLQHSSALAQFPKEI